MDHLRKTRTVAVGLLLVLAASMTGCIGGPLSKESQQVFLEGHKSFEAGDFQDAEAKFSHVIAHNPTSGALSEVYYFRGLARLRTGRRAEAKQDFRKGATTYGRELTQVYSAVALANLEYEEGNDSTAAHLYQQALENRVEGLPVDAALYRLGVSLQRLGRWQEADDALAELISKHGDSPLVASASGRFRATCFTVQVGAFIDRGNARSQAARLQAEGYPALMSVAAGSGRTLYTVSVGRFGTYAQAEATAAQLRDKGYAVLVKP